MDIRKWTVAGAFVLALPAAAFEAECEYNSLTRSVQVVYSAAPERAPCEVMYRKHGQSEDDSEEKSLWRAVNETGYCEAKARGFVDKLTSMGWACAVKAPGPEPVAEAAD